MVKTVISVRQSSSPAKSFVTSKLGSSPFNFHAVATAADRASDKIKEDFDGLSLICVDGACNTTDAKNKDVSTDIIVEVKTNVKSNKSNEVVGGGGDGDIPVVVGNAGTRVVGNRKIDSDGHILPEPTKSPVFVPYNLNSNVQVKSTLDGYDFNPSFNPPPMYVWYKTRTVGVNPQAFNPHSRPHWKTNGPLSDWQRSHTGTRQTTPTGWSPSTVCTCSNPGLNWYPATDQNNGY